MRVKNNDKKTLQLLQMLTLGGKKLAEQIDTGYRDI